MVVDRACCGGRQGLLTRSVVVVDMECRGGRHGVLWWHTALAVMVDRGRQTLFPAAQVFLS